MIFEFKINKYYLIGYALSSRSKPFPSWKRLEQKIWLKYRDEAAYYFLNSKYASLALGKIQTELNDKNFKRVWGKHLKVLKKIYNDILKTKEFKRLYQETKNYLKFVKNQWQKNEKEALKILEEVSGLKIPKQKITVYLTHPKSCNGRTLDKKTIAVGHLEKWQNHITICLCHELLHIMTWGGHFQPHYDILHSLILLNDNELKIRLNKKGRYFKERKLNTEPPELFPLEKKILPYWKKYLKEKLDKVKDISKFKHFLIKQVKSKGRF